MQAHIAAVLNREQSRHKMTIRDFVAMIKDHAEDKKFSYRTYFLAARSDSNMTLNTIDLFSRALKISIAELLFPDRQLTTSMKRLDQSEIRIQVARSLEEYRKRENLNKKEIVALMEINIVSYMQIEKGKQNLTLETIGQMAGKLNIPAWRLLLGEPLGE